MQDPEDFELPEEVAALIPDAVETPETPENARQAISEIQEELSGNRGEQMIEAAKQIPTAKVAINGIFRHPPEFTEEEWDIIVAGLKAHLPLYAIAMKVHCERHFLAKKIQEMKEVAQIAIDSREGIIDEAEFQLYSAARSKSMSAIIYILDHLGKDRGWGEQEERKDPSEDVQIVFGEISQDAIEEGKRKIAEAQKQTTPTLAAELSKLEIPKPPTSHDLAIAEDMVRAASQMQERPPVDVTPIVETSRPPYSNPQMSDDRYNFLENAFEDGGNSPFGSF